MGATVSKGLPFATLQNKNTVQSQPIPTAGGGGAARGGHIIFGQPAWPAPAALCPATKSRDESRSGAKQNEKKSLPTSDSVLINITDDDVKVKQEATPSLSSAIAVSVVGDASAPQQTRPPQQVVVKVEADSQGEYAGQRDTHNKDDTDFKVDTGRENASLVGLWLSTAQYPLPDFAAFLANYNEVRQDDPSQSVDDSSKNSFHGRASVRARRRANRAAKKAKQAAEVVQADADGVDSLAPRMSLPGLNFSKAALAGATGALPSRMLLTGLPQELVQAVERARASARDLDLTPVLRLAPPCIAPLPRVQDLPPQTWLGSTLTMYTDGSWGHDDGSGGAGVAYECSDVWYGRAVALGHILDHHVAELEAIRHAVRMAHSIIPQVRANELLIYTDSETCLWVLSTEEGDGIRVPSMLKHIRDAIQRDKSTLGVEVKFWWVKGHVHTIGNERADVLASHGRTRTEEGDEVGSVYDNPMAEELEKRMQHQEWVARKEKRDLIILGATSLPLYEAWQRRVEQRAAEEEERAEKRLADRLARSIQPPAKQQLRKAPRAGRKKGGRRQSWCMVLEQELCTHHRQNRICVADTRDEAETWHCPTNCTAICLPDLHIRHHDTCLTQVCSLTMLALLDITVSQHECLHRWKCERVFECKEIARGGGTERIGSRYQIIQLVSLQFNSIAV